MAKLTVKQLISELRRMPKDLPVYWRDHDQSEFETNSSAGSVFEMDMDDAPDGERSQPHIAVNPDKYVVIAP